MNTFFHPTNAQGRDFVVGDLHGCHDELMEALSAVGFDEERDRLFSVGDLVDRGPQSFQTLSLLSKPWFHAVLGNHEAMLLTWVGARDSDYHRASDFLNNGGEWVLTLEQAQKRQLLDEWIPRLLDTPYVRQVDHAVTPFCVVHAQRLRGNQVLQDAQLSEPLSEYWLTPLTWGRNLWNAANATCRAPAGKMGPVALSTQPVLPGVGLTYCGHSIMPGAVLHHSHLHLDLGLYRNRQAPVLLAPHDEWARPLRTLFEAHSA